MNIGFINYRYGDTDGVSLKDINMAHAFERLGHKVYYCAGYFKGYITGQTISLLDFNHPEIRLLKKKILNKNSSFADLEKIIFKTADKIQPLLEQFITDKKISVVLTSNVLTIGLNLPFAIALTRISADRKLKIISHGCEFWWQREYFVDSNLKDILDEYLPPKLDTIKHYVINTHSQKRLLTRKGIKAEILPDFFDYSYPFY